MWKTIVLAIAGIAGLLHAQDGQRPSRPGWPCVAGRAVDPGYIELSESTGGQLFLFQKGEVAHSAVVMGASYTHPATILRAVGHLSGTRDFEFPVESGVASLLVLASLQCRSAIQVSRPSGSELGAANSSLNVELQTGRIVRIDSPEAGKWRVRLAGTGLFVLSVLAKGDVALGAVAFYPDGEGVSRLDAPLFGVRQNVETRLSGQVANVGVQLVNASGDPIEELQALEPGAEGIYRTGVTPRAERFRILVTGTDAMASPFQRMHPVLFRARQPR